MDSRVAGGQPKVFDHIYAEGLWHNTKKATLTDKAPASGAGSTPLAARTTCLVLLDAIRRTKSERPAGAPVRILDAPCGDFTWMPGCLARAREAFPETRLRYTGGDIVAELVRQLNAGEGRYLANGKRAAVPPGVELAEFIHLDSADSEAMGRLADRFDIIVSKHMLIHLPSEVVLRVIDGWAAVRPRYVVTDDYPARPNWSYLDLNFSYPYREPNLREPPFSLPDPVCSQPDASFCEFYRMRCHSNINLFRRPFTHELYDPSDRANSRPGENVYRHAKSTQEDRALRLCFNLSAPPAWLASEADSGSYPSPRSQRLLGGFWHTWHTLYPRGFVPGDAQNDGAGERAGHMGHHRP